VGTEEKKKKMSEYIALKSVSCLYFKKDSVLYKIDGTRPMFRKPIKLEDVDNLWIKRLSKEDRKLIEKDLKKFKKI